MSMVKSSLLNVHAPRVCSEEHHPVLSRMLGNAGFILGGIGLVVPVCPRLSKLDGCFTDDLSLFTSSWSEDKL